MTTKKLNIFQECENERLAAEREAQERLSIQLNIPSRKLKTVLALLCKNEEVFVEPSQTEDLRLYVTN
jgi:hypothetical protein